MAKRKSTKALNTRSGGKRRVKAPQAAPRSVEGVSPVPPPPGTALPTAMIVPSPAVAAELHVIEKTRKQKWTGLPKRSKIRKFASAIVALKVQGRSTEEIAEELGLRPKTIRQYMWIAGKNGWLTTADPHEQAESVLVHRVVSNLDEWLHARNEKTGLPDKEVMLEAAKGFGIFKDHKETPEISQQANVLSINIQMPTAVSMPARPDAMGGAPAYVEAEVVKHGE